MKYFSLIILIFCTSILKAQTSITFSKTTVGLSSVDNTSDRNKPISLSQAVRLNSASDSLKKVFASVSNLSLADGKLSAYDQTLKKTIDSLINVIAIMKRDTIIVKARIDSIWNGTAWIKFQ